MRSFVCASLLLPLSWAWLPYSSALAQKYPDKPIRLIVPYSAGGTTDRVARPLAQKLTETLRTQVIVDNRGGGGTMIGANLVAKAPPTGHTFLLCSVATQAASPQLFKDVPYDPLVDFEPVILLATTPILLVSSKQLPIATLNDLISTAKASPGKLTYVSSGHGSPSHLSAELFSSISGIKLLHVVYKGGSESMSDLIAGRVDLKFDSAPGVMPQVVAGNLKAIAISSATRWPDLPTVPTFDEAGWKQYRFTSWFGLCAPARTPKTIIDRINHETQNALASPEYKETLRRIVATPVGGSPQEFAAFIRSEHEKFGKLIKAIGARVD